MPAAWFTGIKSEVNMRHSRWLSSGRAGSGDEVPKVNFCQDNVGMLYCWEFMYSKRDGALWSMVCKTIPPEAAFESFDAGDENDSPIIVKETSGKTQPKKAKASSAPPAPQDDVNGSREDKLFDALTGFLDRASHSTKPSEQDDEFAKEKQQLELENLRAMARKHAAEARIVEAQAQKAEAEAKKMLGEA
eukprot:scaffold34122_cov19-Prasinocladus_malaysianus.AAC.2